MTLDGVIRNCLSGKTLQGFLQEIGDEGVTNKTQVITKLTSKILNQIQEKFGEDSTVASRTKVYYAVKKAVTES